VSRTADPLPGHAGASAGPAREGASFLTPLVLRLSTEYDVDPDEVQDLGDAVLASFAGARVQAFVPVLVEKRLRGTLRGRSGAGPVPTVHADPAAVPG
jgi:hypothetical protein